MDIANVARSSDPAAVKNQIDLNLGKYSGDMDHLGMNDVQKLEMAKTIAGELAKSAIARSTGSSSG